MQIMSGSEMRDLPVTNYAFVREKLLNREEIALLDVREEAPHAEGHPLFAANLPWSQIELNAYDKLPRFDVPVVTIDSGEGLAEAAADRLLSLGYKDVSVFSGGVAAWKEAGGELFIDVNVPSKAFGEMMEEACHTPSLPAEEVKALIDAEEDIVIVDVRRFDEYQTMCIPGGISVPGAELVRRVPDLAERPETKVIVNCAGRTRSLIGTQSLINAGLPNSVTALRNGTIGWTLANQELDVGQSRTYGETPEQSIELAKSRARTVADNAGVKRANKSELGAWADQNQRTTYFFDVRTQEEYELSHFEAFSSVPGGQLVQETEMQAPVRGARIVLLDDDGVRANMTASWLAQMAWDVYVLDGLVDSDFSVTGAQPVTLPSSGSLNEVKPSVLHDWMQTNNDVVVVDVAKHKAFKEGHISGAWYMLRSLLAESVSNLPPASRYVVTCNNGSLSKFVAPELEEKIDGEVFVLSGGTRAWMHEGYDLESGEEHLSSEPIDRYRRPYEGTDVSRETMQAYLDWEFGLIEQMNRDASHHFEPRSLAL